HSQPVHNRIYALEHCPGWHVPADQDHCQGGGQPHSAHAQRLLRYARPGRAGKRYLIQVMLFRKHRALKALGLTFWLAAAGLFSQQQPQASRATTDSSATLIHVDTRVVVCHATVVDKAGHLVTTLPQAAFTVFENGVKQDIRVFKREDVPVSLGLVIDNSGSMRNKLAQVKAAALALVQDSNREDEVFVVNFNDTAYMDF